MVMEVINSNAVDKFITEKLKALIIAHLRNNSDINIVCEQKWLKSVSRSMQEWKESFKLFIQTKCICRWISLYGCVKSLQNMDKARYKHRRCQFSEVLHGCSLNAENKHRLWRGGSIRLFSPPSFATYTKNRQRNNIGHTSNARSCNSISYTFNANANCSYIKANGTNIFNLNRGNNIGSFRELWVCVQFGELFRLRAVWSRHSGN